MCKVGKWAIHVIAPRQTVWVDTWRLTHGKSSAPIYRTRRVTVTWTNKSKICVRVGELLKHIFNQPNGPSGNAVALMHDETLITTETVTIDNSGFRAVERSV